MKTLAAHFTPSRGGQKIRLIVIHTMECGETLGKAKQVLNWFMGKAAPQASAHYMVDSNSSFQLVDDGDTAWAVDDFSLNQQSISIELAGSASQTITQWQDAYSSSELTIASHLVADLSSKYGIPVVKLSPAEILEGKQGICGHADITAAKQIKGGHTDPGINFPWAVFIAQVSKLRN